MKEWIKYGLISGSVLFTLDIILSVYGFLISSPEEAKLMAVALINFPGIALLNFLLGPIDNIPTMIFAGLLTYFVIGFIIGAIFSLIMVKVKKQKL